LDLATAAAEDDLKLTLDYGKIYLQVREIVENNSYNLLEHLAHQIIKLALSYPQVKKVKVRVEKPAAKAGNAEFRAQVALEREKD
jgi:dihydroneopterin aldolase